jgi:hypothetical protein
VTPPAAKYVHRSAVLRNAAWASSLSLASSSRLIPWRRRSRCSAEPALFAVINSSRLSRFRQKYVPSMETLLQATGSRGASPTPSIEDSTRPAPRERPRL